jgi:ABC-type lipoprotein export system ATPase subunit
MIISLQNVVPIPLKDKLLQRKSDIWNTEVTFSKTSFTKIKAPSGTGKTTLIHYLYNMRNDYTGTVSYDHINVQSIDTESLSTLRQQKVSVIFQDLRLFQHLTALENIELKRTMQKPIYTIEKVKEMASLLGVTHILNQPAKICSYGEQQRIAIIRSLMQPFELLLMDEPFSHLDKENTSKAATLIASECKQRNAGFVLTDLDEDDNFSYTQFLNL